MAGTPLEHRYSRVAVWFHWTTAALIIANLLLGFFHEDFGREARATAMFVHKATGITVLLLSIARLGWRFRVTPPTFDPLLRPWEVILARSVHWLFYILMIIIPLSGWLLSSSSGRATNFWGMFEIPPLPIGQGDDLHDFFEEAHELLGFGMVGLIALHVAGALKHHVQGHRHLIGRMAPCLYRTQ